MVDYTLVKFFNYPNQSIPHYCAFRKEKVWAPSYFNCMVRGSSKHFRRTI